MEDAKDGLCYYLHVKPKGAVLLRAIGPLFFESGTTNQGQIR